VARLGGEEFAILCAHTAASGAAIKAEKIRLTVENTKFPHGEKQPMGKVSISLGVSEYPSFVIDSQALIRSADDALYKVKQGGRNRVAMADVPQGFTPEFQALTPPPYGGTGSGTGGGQKASG
jgi:diguanylate cyclase (GGDEF)-like protein